MLNPCIGFPFPIEKSLRPFPVFPRAILKCHCKFARAVGVKLRIFPNKFMCFAWKNSCTINNRQAGRLIIVREIVPNRF